MFFLWISLYIGMSSSGNKRQNLGDTTEVQSDRMITEYLQAEVTNDRL